MLFVTHLNLCSAVMINFVQLYEEEQCPVRAEGMPIIFGSLPQIFCILFINSKKVAGQTQVNGNGVDYCICKSEYMKIKL